ncbi:MAG: hypothetical protein COT74_11240 [Bdellovibrionales bacterium CG10_big_fil_rev_8_21_14_0_10_45_34]|nr:MAG: hypothetical protein COT74_11240 [Bdellovibrionales bacterium CG10_big_fil_rev_8_21_14_0_10_45_34]
MSKRLLPILVVSLASLNVYASNVCNTLSECQNLRASVEQRIRQLMAGQVAKFGTIVKIESDNALYVRQTEAIKYCKENAMSLPTARELARLATSLGAAGISETPREGYHLISAKNTDGVIDIFYFNPTGYSNPSETESFLWSSSIRSDNSRFGYGLSKSGQLEYHPYDVSAPEAFKCVLRLR